MGIPFVAVVIFDETGIVFPESFNNGYLGSFIVGCIGGLLSGLLQMHTLKSLSQYSGWWIVISTIGWGIASLPFTIVSALDLVLGGIILGTISGISILWLLKFPLDEPID